jgi:hypothetical protein
MGSRSRSDNRTSSTSNVDQDIFGQTTGDVTDSLVAAGDIDQQNEFLAINDQSQNVGGDFNTSVSTNVVTERADTDVLLRSIEADERQSELLAIGFTNFADGLEANSARSIELARDTSGQAFSFAQNAARETGKQIERGLETVSDSLSDFGELTGGLLDQQGAATAKLLAANRTETAQGFDSLQETLIAVAGIGAAAFVLTRL